MVTAENRCDVLAIAEENDALMFSAKRVNATSDAADIAAAYRIQHSTKFTIVVTWKSRNFTEHVRDAGRADFYGSWRCRIELQRLQRHKHNRVANINGTTENRRDAEKDLSG